jgi:hypothetical protein
MHPQIEKLTIRGAANSDRTQTHYPPTLPRCVPALMKSTSVEVLQTK